MEWGREGRTWRGGFRKKQVQQVCPVTESITPRKPTYPRAHPDQPWEAAPVTTRFLDPDAGRQAAKRRAPTCMWTRTHTVACASLGDSASVCVEICKRGDPWVYVSTHSEVAYASPGTGDHGVRWEHHCPEQGASGQSLRLLTGFRDSSFQGSSRSSCFWRHPGANSDG